MKRTAVFTAIITLFTSVAYSQVVETNVSRSIVSEMTPEQIARIKAQNPNIDLNVLGPSREQVRGIAPANGVSVQTTVQTTQQTTQIRQPARSLRIEDETTIARENELLAQRMRYARGIFSEVGQPDAKSAALEGYAKDLPLVEVLNQILPEGWKATAVKNANTSKKVSWQGGESWNKILEKITYNNGLNIMLNWNDKVVRVLDDSQVEAINRSKEKVEVMSFGPPPTTVVQTTTTTVQPVMSVVAPGMNSWRIKQGSLRDNLLEWSEIGKFKLIYPDTVSNYPIDDDGFGLVGPLDGETGALAQLAGLYGEGRVKQPLEFDLKTGGAVPVLIIRNKSYDQRFFKEANSLPDPK